MTRHLVTVEGENGEIVAGIYIDAESKTDATAKVRAWLSTAKLVSWGKR